MTARRQGPVLALAGLVTAGLALSATATGAPVRFSVATEAGGSKAVSSRYADSVAVAVTLRGRAPRGHVIRAATRCGAVSCLTTATAGKDRRWTLTLDTVVPRTQRTVAIQAVDASASDGAVAVTRTFTVRAPSSPASARGPALIMTGDSLAVGTATGIAGELSDWTVTTTARVGRTLQQGLRLLDAAELPTGSRVLAFSLFTNNDPIELPQLETAIRDSVQRAGAGGCAIWATVARPPAGKRTYDAVNRRLRSLAADPALAPGLRLVEWKRALAEHPSWRAKDKVHATTTGYRERARMYAEAARSCMDPSVAPASTPASTPTGGAEAPTPPPG